MKRPQLSFVGAAVMLTFALGSSDAIGHTTDATSPSPGASASADVDLGTSVGSSGVDPHAKIESDLTRESSVPCPDTAGQHISRETGEARGGMMASLDDDATPGVRAEGQLGDVKGGAILPGEPGDVRADAGIGGPFAECPDMTAGTTPHDDFGHAASPRTDLDVNEPSDTREQSIMNRDDDGMAASPRTDVDVQPSAVTDESILGG